MSERIRAIANHMKLLTYEEMRLISMGLADQPANAGKKVGRLPALQFAELLHAWSNKALATLPQKSPPPAPTLSGSGTLDLGPADKVS